MLAAADRQPSPWSDLL